MVWGIRPIPLLHLTHAVRRLHIERSSGVGPPMLAPK